MAEDSENVHFLSPSLDFERVTRPLNRGEPPADRAIIYNPPASHPFPERACEQLEAQLEQFDIEADGREVESYRFEEITRQAYSDIRNELIEGNTVYINTAGGTHQIATATTTAATFVIGDAIQEDSSKSIEDIRERISLYHTEPSTYHLDELLQAVRRIQEITREERLQTLDDRAHSLKERIDQDRKTVRELEGLLKQDLLSTVESMEHIGIEDLPPAAVKLFEGLNMTTDALDEMSRDEAWQEGEYQFLLSFIPGLDGVTDLMDEVRTDDEELEPADLMQYFGERLETISQIILGVSGEDGLIRELERLQSASHGEEEDVFSKVGDHGVASGVYEFNEQSYNEIPGPAQFDLRGTERALLYTLGQIDSAESVRQFTKEVLHQTVLNASQTSVELPDHPTVSKLRDSPDPEDYPTELLESIQSTVQYNLGKLDGKGFIRRVTKGQKETRIEFRRAGEIYVESKLRDVEWPGNSFEKLASSINSSLEPATRD